MSERDTAIERIEIIGPFDRRDAEALQLELRRLAKRHGVEIEDLRIEEVRDEAG